ncbi:hypothetical protein D3C78_1498960 [compost metagenome]
MALGRSGRVLATCLRNSAMRFQAVGGFQSMKKQGPAPWGTNSVGMREVGRVVEVMAVLRAGQFDGPSIACSIYADNPPTTAFTSYQ